MSSDQPPRPISRRVYPSAIGDAPPDAPEGPALEPPDPAPGAWLECGGSGRRPAARPPDDSGRSAQALGDEPSVVDSTGAGRGWTQRHDAASGDSLRCASFRAGPAQAGRRAPEERRGTEDGRAEVRPPSSTALLMTCRRLHPGDRWERTPQGRNGPGTLAGEPPRRPAVSVLSLPVCDGRPGERDVVPRERSRAWDSSVARGVGWALLAARSALCPRGPAAGVGIARRGSERRSPAGAGGSTAVRAEPPGAEWLAPGDGVRSACLVRRAAAACSGGRCPPAWLAGGVLGGPLSVCLVWPAAVLGRALSGCLVWPAAACSGGPLSVCLVWPAACSDGRCRGAWSGRRWRARAGRCPSAWSGRWRARAGCCRGAWSGRRWCSGGPLSVCLVWPAAVCSGGPLSGCLVWPRVLGRALGGVLGGLLSVCLVWPPPGCSDGLLSACLVWPAPGWSDGPLSACSGSFARAPGSACPRGDDPPSASAHHRWRARAGHRGARPRACRSSSTGSP